MVRKCQPYTIGFISLKYVGTSNKGVPYGFIRMGLSPDDTFDKDEVEYVDTSIYALLDALKTKKVIVDEYSTKDYVTKDGMSKQNIDLVRFHLDDGTKSDEECPW